MHAKDKVDRPRSTIYDPVRTHSFCHTCHILAQERSSKVNIKLTRMCRPRVTMDDRGRYTAEEAESNPRGIR